MSSILTLLKAAEFIEGKEKRDTEHGYATVLPLSEEYSKKKTKGKKTQGARSTHNELEKNRRAHLRQCLEKLKDLVPLAPETNRHTTLGLLTKARNHIKNLEDKDRGHNQCMDRLKREQRHLIRRLELLTAMRYRACQERSISECSTSTNSTTSTSESDEVDILGSNSEPSDTDDHCSVGSGGSDGCSLDWQQTFNATVTVGGGALSESL